tara:strand:+ start:461 stop:820 length:360 start_codon:yes stop_codon:yes gene_type:complete
MKPIHFRHQVGNTNALLNGAKNTKCIFLVRTEQDARYLMKKNKDLNAKGMSSDLSGVTIPIVLDHTVFELVQSENRRLEVAIEDSTKIIKRQIFLINSYNFEMTALELKINELEKLKPK